MPTSTFNGSCVRGFICYLSCRGAGFVEPALLIIALQADKQSEEARLSEIFPSLPKDIEMGDIFRAFPKTAAPLLEYHDRLLRDHSPLTIAERELIAAYVSGLNACTYCYGAHHLAARAFGVDEAMFEGLIEDVDSAAIDEKMKPILRYVKKLTQDPPSIRAADAQAVYEAGWDEAALFDAISVCALFNFMNRIVEGSGLRANPLAMSDEIQQERMERMSGGIGEYAGAREGPRQYGKLYQLWGIGKAES